MSSLPIQVFFAYSLPTQAIQRVVILILTILWIGCSRPLETPELHDPIYNDLIKTSEQFKNEYEEANKLVQEAKKDLKKAPLGTIERKQFLKTLSTNEAKLTYLSQMAKYYHIRAKKRKIEAKKRYHLAYQEGLPWPDQSEYEHYQTEKKLRHASRSWNQRVPKLQDRLKPQKTTYSEPK